ncbi:MAG: response regulator transcription factor [Candidatus Melainabacteria bacterium]|nr:response regulator transcription factor [Candidatus Melainabacteria bacterium]
MRILIVEDVPALRAHARQVIEKVFANGVEIIEATNGVEGVKLAKTLAPDLTLMDISMPELNGVKAAEEIWESNKQARILFWSQFHREAYVRSLGRIVPDEAIHGYLLKGESDEKLAFAIESILLRGDPYIDPVVQGVQNRLKSKDDSLSDTEYETLLDVAIGMTDRAIAARRHISVRGVQNRLSMLLTKLVKGQETHIRESAGMEIFNPRTRIVFEGIKRGLVDPDDLPKLDTEVWNWIEDEFDYDAK